MNLTGRRLNVRFFQEQDAKALLDFHVRNRDFFQAFTALRSEDFYTVDYQTDRIQKKQAEQEADVGYMFGIFLTATDELIGVIDLTDVARGALQCCWVGYYLDEAHNGQGYMTEAVRLVVDYAFDVLELHRLEAGVMPHNAGSLKVLEKAGFHQEGLCVKNVRINGVWQDHVHLAIVNPRD